MKNLVTVVLVTGVLARVEASSRVARLWDEQILTAIPIGLPWNDDPAGTAQALDSSLLRTEPATGSRSFFRVVRSLQ